MSQQDINRYMKQGIAAAKAGDKETARRLFEQVIEIDKNFEKAWLYMAMVVDTETQRRVCLNNVLYLNPGNQKARQMLAKLDAGDTGAPAIGAAGGGLNRRMLLIGGGVVLAALLVLLVIILGSGGGGGPTPTQPVEVGGGGNGGEAAADDPTAVLETATPTPVPPTPTLDLPPTWTPSPAPEIEVIPTATPFPTPTGLTGWLAYTSGPRFFAERFADIYYAFPDGSEPFLLGNMDNNTRGRNPVFSPDSQFIAWEKGASDGSSRLYVSDWYGDYRDFATLLTGINFAFELQPAWIPVSGKYEIAFAGTSIVPSLGYNTDIYILQFRPDPRSEEVPEITQLTDNPFENTWPAWSPDGAMLMYVTDRRAQGGTDLRIIDLAGFSQAYIATQQAATLQAGATPAPPTEPPAAVPTSETPAGLVTPTLPPVEEKAYDRALTTDGNALRERAPDWSSDGRRVVFEGTTVNTDDLDDYDSYDSDIYIIDDVFAADPKPRLLFPLDDEEESARDMQPRFSPDGTHITFTSDRTGGWEIYILEIATGEIFQVTNNDQIDMVSDWGISR